MASIVSPKNVGKLIITTALASETTNTTFVSGATLGEIALVKADGAAVAANQPFKVVHKKADRVDVSDTVDPLQIDFVKVGTYVAEQAKIVTVSGFTGTVRSNATYRVSIKRYDGIGSPENFRHLHAFYVTGPATAVTYTNIQDSMEAQLNSQLRRLGEDSEIVVTSPSTTLVFTGQVQGFTLGRNAGDPVLFDVEVSVQDNSPATLAEAGATYSVFTVTTTQEAKPGVGTFKQVALTEYSWNGYETADYGREMSFPNNFIFTPLATAGTTYNTIIVGFHKDRTSVNVERQFKELVIVVPFTDLASNAATNAILAKLRVAAPATGLVPANLAVV